MKILVVGSGGREHALIKGILKNPAVTEIYALPGNGGIAKEPKVTCVPIGAEEVLAVAAFAGSVEGLELAVIGPDDPLAMGLADLLRKRGIPCFGPSMDGARLESSKVFAKEFMQRHNIPTARFSVFSSVEKALSLVKQAPLPLVVKADGLAKGKGVVVAKTRKTAMAAVLDSLENKVFGKSGERILIEECLEGPEVSVLAFCDGKTLIPMVSSMDHKAALNGDEGPNTGGMGVVAPNPFYDEKMAALCWDVIFKPTLEGLQKESISYQGCLYFGLMLTKDGPKVIEYNCRFGDPEAQAVLPLLQSDLLSVLMATAQGKLSEATVSFAKQASCCVVLASKGYPGKLENQGAVILVPEEKPGVIAYHAGTKLEKDGLTARGGRVLGITAVADTLEQAVSKAYAAVPDYLFYEAHYRTDIGKTALAYLTASREGEE